MFIFLPFVSIYHAIEASKSMFFSVFIGPVERSIKPALSATLRGTRP